MVINQEAGQGGGEDTQHPGLIQPGGVVNGELKAEKKGGNGRNAGREAVHIVQQVDGVGDADQPEECDQDVERVEARPRQEQPR